MFYTFLKGISQEVNVIALVEIELAKLKITFQCFSHYVTENPMSVIDKIILKLIWFLIVCFNSNNHEQKSRR